MTLDLGVVIVTHDSAADLAACLASLFEHAGEVTMSVVVSDAGSTDATAAAAAGFPVVFVAGENDGFARGCNRVLDHPAIRDARYVLFLNPDTTIEGGTLDDLLARCDTRPGSGVFSVCQLNQHGAQFYSMYRFPTAFRVLAEAIEWEPIRRHGQALRDPQRYAEEGDCDWVNGSFLLVRRQALEELGGFDERFFLYSEEVDLCRRARIAGWHVTYVPAMTYMHRTAGRGVSERDRLLTLSQLTYARKWLSPPRRVALRAAIVAKHALRAIDPSRGPTGRAKARLSLRGALTWRVQPARSP